MAKKSIISLILSVIGVIFIVGSVAAFAVMQYRLDKGNDLRAELMTELQKLTPQTIDVAPDDRGITEMSCVQVKGFDLWGYIEVPAYDRALPVSSSNESFSLDYFPIRYSGSVHDGTLILAGKPTKGQFDFINKISNQDDVSFTDVDGLRYSFSVFDIKRFKSVSEDVLGDIEADLILFARNLYSFDYTVVCCKYK